MFIHIDSIIARADKVTACHVRYMTLQVFIEGISTPLEQVYSSPAEARKAMDSFARMVKLALDKSANL